MNQQPARLLVMIAALSMLPGGCGSKPAAEVSKDELAAMRSANAAMNIGDSKKNVLAGFSKGNVVKLGSSSLGGAAIEEWKAEGFHDQDKHKDLFVTFLYFCNDKFVDSSDTRIDFRANDALVERWQASVK